jgi:hypothetical protein
MGLDNMASKEELQLVYKILHALDVWSGTDSDAEDSAEVIPTQIGYTDEVTAGELHEAMYIIDQLIKGTK